MSDVYMYVRLWMDIDSGERPDLVDYLTAVGYSESEIRKRISCELEESLPEFDSWEELVLRMCDWMLQFSVGSDLVISSVENTRTPEFPLAEGILGGDLQEDDRGGEEAEGVYLLEPSRKERALCVLEKLFCRDEAQKDERKPVKSVRIPATKFHEGFGAVEVRLHWLCPVCGGPRGEIHPARSYDGSRILYCDGWSNPCGHVDTYKDCRVEAASNGLNQERKKE
ncbi:MAG: hypothetical protein HPY85_06715 [Anaerolineae bacterium]|nr:hypothetical protein [Anaerolineae bacterium]